MLGYLSTDIVCSEKQTVFRERSSRKTVSFEEQIMSKDRYPSIFSPQMEAIVFIILQIFFATRAVFFENWGIFNNYYSTNCNTIQIWSWCSRYPSSVGDGYPAIYVASYVGRKSEVKKCWQKGLKMLRAWKSILLSICWIIKQLSCSILRNIVWF